VNAPDYVEPVLGWRMWWAVESGGELHLSSVFYSVTWPHREPLVATCNRFRLSFWRFGDRHAAPGERCECGVYAAPLKSLRTYLQGSFRMRRMPVVGRVALWGTVLEHERGWRASIAYPERLYIATFGGKDADASRIAEGLGAYGVPVTTLDVSTPRAAIAEIEALAA
jgi:hypothetical protein